MKKEELSQLETDLLDEINGVQITLNFDKESYKKIMKDNSLFNNNGHITSFISKIIVNHYEEFNARNNKLKGNIQNYLKQESELWLEEEQYKTIIWRVITELNKTLTTTNEVNSKNKDRKVTIKTTKQNCKDFSKLVTYKPTKVGVASYLTGIVLSYLKLPSYIREQIIYKKEVEEIKIAIENKQMISFKNVNGKVHKKVSPYAICPSKEEIYSYMVYQEKDKYGKESSSSVHISRISWVQRIPESSSFDVEVIKQFEIMEKNGYQFPLYNFNHYQVRLNESGRTTFQSRYLEKPELVNEIDEHDNSNLEFDCSDLQFSSYFSPFYENAIVLSPKSTVKKTIAHYEKAIEEYKKEFPDLFDENGKMVK